MKNAVYRVYVEKKSGFEGEADGLFLDLRENLGISGLQGVRILHRYDIAGVTYEEYLRSRETVFSEPTVDHVYDEEFPVDDHEKVFAVEYLPGQYDQRADSAAQCVQIITQKERPQVLSAKVIVLKGEITLRDLEQIKAYYINPVDSREASLVKPETLDLMIRQPDDVSLIKGFTQKSAEEIAGLHDEMGLAMSKEDLLFCQTYFRDEEKRDPTVTEIRVIDTYWSDHCRHTTFLTEIEKVELEKGYFNVPVETAYRAYLKSRDLVYGDKPKDICLMDIATMGMKELRKQGKLPDLDESDEIGRCGRKRRRTADHV